jgi:hypothetical protein
MEIVLYIYSSSSLCLAGFHLIPHTGQVLYILLKVEFLSITKTGQRNEVVVKVSEF